MNYIGTSDKTIKWFHSYLRAFFVSLDNVFSEAGTISCGVQVSILGPLLFLLYINDISQALPNTYLHADDTSIFYQHKDVTKIENVLNKNLGMCANRLLIISCQFILVEIKLAFSNLPELDRTYNHNRVKQVHIIE